MSERYRGGCHCGEVRYEVEMNLDQLVTCNCSICSKRGSILGFVPEEKFLLLSGEESLTDYQFGKKTIHHLFCKTCGILSFARGAMPDGTAMAAINVRTLDDIDPEALKPARFDGKSV